MKSVFALPLVKMPDEDSIRTAKELNIDAKLLTVMFDNERLTVKGLGPRTDPDKIGIKTVKVTLEGRMFKYKQALRNCGINE